MSSFAIEIVNLNKIYQKSAKSPAKEALRNVNLQIKKGSFFGLLGPNGAGKSTIINVLAGLVQKTSGLVKICDIDIDKNQKTSKFKIGIVPQELVLDPFFTVRETLEIYAGYFGLRKNERRTDEIIEALGLQDKADAAPRSLSGGMKRRLLIAKALVHNPEILVLDEPTAGVDVDLRSQLWSYIRKLNKSGTTIVLTTHYLEEAEELCDEIAVINKGGVVVVDKKENLMQSLNQKEIIITFENDLKYQDISTPNEINVQQIAANQISFSYDPSKIALEKFLHNISSGNVAIKDITTKQPDLEDVFKFLVKN